MALCIWREARGQSELAQAAIKHVIVNRVRNPVGPFVKCHDVVSTILCPYQFSSFNRNDPNSSLIPNPVNVADWEAWKQVCFVVDEYQEDPTGGANYYFSVNITPPSWADPAKQTAQIGPFRFFKL